MLEALFNPKSIAVIGVSRSKKKVGRQVFDNIKKFKFSGRCFPVNPKASEIQGNKCYSSVKAIPYPVELVILAVPSSITPQIIGECGEKKVKAAVVISAGFKEIGIAGSRLEVTIKDLAKRYSMRLLGPNCLGVINTHANLNASFVKASDIPQKGNISIVSQSGALGTSILDWAKGNKVGFSKFASLGNKADISEVDLLEVLMKDETTEVVGAYLENVGDGTQFIKKAYALSRRKPIVAIKSGMTGAGARAVSSHTGVLAGTEAAYIAAFDKSGIVRAGSLESFFDFLEGFSYQPLPKKTRVAILTNAGGPGIMTADACEFESLTLAGFEWRTANLLRENLPLEASVLNPVDILGDATVERYKFSAEALLKDPNVDALIVILTPQAGTEVEGVARALVEVKERRKKPMYASFMGGSEILAGVNVLKRERIPNYCFPERAVRMCRAAASYSSFRAKAYPVYSSYRVRESTVKRIFDKVKGRTRRSITGIDGARIVAAYGIKTVKQQLVTSVSEAVEVAREIGYPVVLKTASSDILHKSDVGGVKLDIETRKELEYKYHQIVQNVRKFMPEAVVEGIIIQKMATECKETILGASVDPQFGPLIMFGLGGIYVEVLRDVSFKIPPLTYGEAEEMIMKLRTYPLLRGVRGEKGVDLDSLIDTILRFSQLLTDFPEIVEAEINPLMVCHGRGGITAVDVRLSLSLGR